MRQEQRQEASEDSGVTRFERTIATNALSALDSETREELQRLYVLVGRVNYLFEELMHIRGTRTVLSDPYQATTFVRDDLLRELAIRLPETIRMLEDALGRGDRQ